MSIKSTNLLSRLVVCGLLVFLHSVSSSAQINDEEARKWHQPVQPFRIVGDVFYVGAMVAPN